MTTARTRRQRANAPHRRRARRVKALENLESRLTGGFYNPPEGEEDKKILKKFSRRKDKALEEVETLKARTEVSYDRGE